MIVKTVSVIARSETTKQSLSFEWFEIAVSAFGLLAMTMPNSSFDRELGDFGLILPM